MYKVVISRFPQKLKAKGEESKSKTKPKLKLVKKKNWSLKNFYK